MITTAKPIDIRLEWINEVNEILSKKELEIRYEGRRLVSDYDIVLSYFSGNTALLNVIPETKKILFGYLKSLEKIAAAAKMLHEVQTRLSNLQPIKIGSEYYFIRWEDRSIFRQEDLEKIEEARKNLQEAFRNIARKYLYTFMAGIEELPMQLPYREEPQVSFPEPRQIQPYMLQPTQPQLPSQPMQPRQGGGLG